MRNNLSVLKKSLAVVLALILAFPAGVLTSVVSYAGPATVAVTDAELVADNYSSLTDGEKAMLRSGLAAGGAHTYHTPDKNDGLVSVSADEKKIDASDYTSDGLTWKPVSAEIVYSGGSEKVALTNGKGTFRYSGSTYSVEVEYQAGIAVDASLQEKLLNGPARLVKGLANLAEVDSFEPTFSTIGTNSAYLVKLTDGSLPFSLSLTNQNTIDAILRIDAQAKANDGCLDIDLMLFKYEDAASKTGYLFTNGADFRQTFIAIYNDIKTINDDEGVNTLYEMVKDTPDGRRLRTALNALKTLIEGTKNAYEDEWEILDAANSPFKSGLTGDDHKTLDTLAAAASGAVLHDDAIIGSLSVAPVIVSANVNQHNVNVTLKASVIKPTAIDSTQTTALEEHTAVVSVLDGSDAAAVLAAVEDNGIEALALAAWGEISAENYTRTVSDLPAALTSDAELVISYLPKELTVTCRFDSDLPATVPYGYNMTLPNHPDESKVYDYLVDGEPYMQGDVCRITKNVTITRTEGKPWDTERFFKLVADSYSDILTSDEADLLGSVALKSAKVLLRTPSNDDGLVTVSAGASGNSDIGIIRMRGGSFSVTADDYFSGINGLNWTAEKGRAVTVSGEIAAEFTFTSGAAVFSCDEFDHIEVDYKLTLSNFSASEVLDAVNLPGVLAAEAKSQKDNMDFFDQLYDQLGELDKKTLNQIQVGVNGSEMSQEAKDAVVAIINGCVDKENSKLYLYEYLTEYHSSGLSFYYSDNNYLKIRNQINILNDNLSIIYNDEKFLPLLEDIGYVQYYDQIGDIIRKLSGVEITDPNPAIDATSPSLSDLVAKIERLIGSSRAFDSADKPVTMTETLTAAAPDRAVVTVTVRTVNSKGETVASKSSALTFSLTSALTDKDISDINALADSLISELAVDKVHYETSDTMTLTSGDYLTGNVRLTFTYSPKQYSSVVKDETGETVATKDFYFDVPTIELDPCAESGMQYRYTVCGSKITVGSSSKNVTFTTAQIDDGSYALITRETVDVYREELMALITDLNEGIAASGLSDGSALSLAFIPMEDADGNICIVLRVSPDNIEKLGDGAQKIAESIVGSSFTHISIGGEFLREGSVISLQAMVDALLTSGVSFDTFLEIITPEGAVNEMTLTGVTPIGAEDVEGLGQSIKVGSKYITRLDLLGGKLFETGMTFGTSADDAGISARLYVTLEDFGKLPNDLKSYYDLAKKGKTYGNVTLRNKTVDAELTLPERIYQMYLTAMIALGDSSLSDIGTVDTVSGFNTILELVKQIAADDTITVSTFENTASKAGQNISLDEYRSYYGEAVSYLKLILDNSTFRDETGTADSYAAGIDFDIAPILDEIGLADSLRGLIKEASSGITAGVKVRFNNKADYQALIVDVNAPDAEGMVKYTRSAVNDVKKINDNAVVILLSDMTGDLVFNKEAILDLNGHKLTGDLVCNKAVRVIDSRIDTFSGAEISGSVSGRAIITAGKFASDVSAFVDEGYIIESGTVRNAYFFLEENESGFDVHITPDAGLLSSIDKDFVMETAIEVASDILLNYFTAASLKVDGHAIYSFDIDNVLSLVDGADDAKINEILDLIDCAGITDLINEVIASFTDLETLGNAIQTGGKVAEYVLTSNNWKIGLTHVTEGDYLSVNIGADTEKTGEQKAALYIDDVRGLGKAVSELGKITAIEASAELSDLSFENKTLGVTAGGSAEAVIDATRNPDYAVMVGVMLASASARETRRQALIEAIKLYYLSDSMVELRLAVENSTTNDLVRAIDSDKTFAQMLSDLGLTDVVKPSVGDLFDLYKDLMKIVKALISELTGYTGSDGRIGARVTETGVYKIYKENYLINKEFALYGAYKLGANVSFDRISVVIKLFPDKDSCRVRVTADDGSELYKGNNINDAFAAAESGCTVTVSDEVSLTADIDLAFNVSLEGGEYIDFAGYSILINGPDTALSTDVQISGQVLSADPEYRVVETEDNGTYTYSLRQYRVTVKDKNGVVIHAGDDLVKALAAATDGSNVKINGYVSLAANAALDKSIAISGGANIGGGSYKINLSGAAVLTSDADLSSIVASGSDEHHVKEEKKNGSFIYKLVQYKVIVRDKTGKLLYAGDALNTAFAKASAGGTVKVNDTCSLTADAALAGSIELIGAAKIEFGSFKLLLGSASVALTADARINKNVGSGNKEYYVTESASGGSYGYKLTHYAIVAADKSGNIVYTGDDLNKAFSAAASGSTIKISSAVALKANVKLDKQITVTGSGYIKFSGFTVTLGNSTAILKTDTQITANVKSGSQYSEVSVTGRYVYSLKALTPVVNAPTAKKGALIKGVSVDSVKKLIILDILDQNSIKDFKLAGNGITAAQFEELVTFSTKNASSSTEVIKIKGKNADGNALIPTGATVEVTAVNPDTSEKVKVTYTVVILGDINCNGRVDSGDAKRMLDHYFGKNVLTGTLLIAGDVNRNGRVESGDAVKNTVKYNRPADYRSNLK